MTDISPTFIRRYPRAAALAREIALEVSYSNGTYWADNILRLTGNASTIEDAITTIREARARRAGMSIRGRCNRLIEAVRAAFHPGARRTCVLLPCLDDIYLVHIDSKWLCGIVLRDNGARSRWELFMIGEDETILDAAQDRIALWREQMA